jgi:hypothetical protein
LGTGAYSRPGARTIRHRRVPAVQVSEF